MGAWGYMRACAEAYHSERKCKDRDCIINSMILIFKRSSQIRPQWYVTGCCGGRAYSLGSQNGDHVPANERRGKGRCLSLSTNAVGQVHKHTIEFVCLARADSTNAVGQVHKQTIEFVFLGRAVSINAVCQVHKQTIKFVYHTWVGLSAKTATSAARLCGACRGPGHACSGFIACNCCMIVRECACGERYGCGKPR